MMILGDCIEKMQELISQQVKVDLTVTSPPYDNLRNYNKSLAWNGKICKKIIRLLFDITGDGGVVVWVVNDSTHNCSESCSSFKQALMFRHVGFNLFDTMIYAKSSFLPLTHKRYEQAFEYMFVFSKGKPKTINLFTEPTITKRNRTDGMHRDQNGLKKKRLVVSQEKKIKSNIWYYSNANNRSKENYIIKHPATFPEQLAGDHILSWSNENDIVLDPFMGSGTTGVMALKLNRQFIGIEKVEEFFNIATNRIDKDLKQEKIC